MKVERREPNPVDAGSDNTSTCASHAEREECFLIGKKQYQMMRFFVQLAFVFSSIMFIFGCLLYARADNLKQQLQQANTEITNLRVAQARLQSDAELEKLLTQRTLDKLGTCVLERDWCHMQRHSCSVERRYASTNFSEMRRKHDYLYGNMTQMVNKLMQPKSDFKCDLFGLPIKAYSMGVLATAAASAAFHGGYNQQQPNAIYTEPPEAEEIRRAMRAYRTQNV